ncbi:MAG: thermonuclease family protein [Desulfocapsa sp.]|nr:thermonuclease family protein [Desulfocapsa sp.]
MLRDKKKIFKFSAYVIGCLLTVLPVFFVVATGVAGQSFKAEVVKVVDGDSIHVRYKGRTIRVRLWGIDTPEWSQPFSKVAKNYTAKLVSNTEVKLEEKDWDDYGRMVALVTMEDKRCLSEELLQAGLAWVHVYYCREPICKKWREYEKQARERQLGLWRDKSPVPPWVWKRKKKK